MKEMSFNQKFWLLLEDYIENIKQIKDYAAYRDLTLKPKTMEELKTDALEEISLRCGQILKRLGGDKG